MLLFKSSLSVQQIVEAQRKVYHDSRGAGVRLRKGNANSERTSTEATGQRPSRQKAA